MTRDDDFLSRWSRRKHATRRGEVVPELAPPLGPAAAAPAMPGTQPPLPVPPEAGKAEVELPPVESLTHESDFTPFMREGVDPLLRQKALRTLFRDPRFNVMDGLDVYIDDFSKPDPIPPDWLGKMNQMARLGDYKPPEAVQEPAQEPVAATEADPIDAGNQELASTNAIPDGVPQALPSPNPELKDS